MPIYRSNGLRPPPSMVRLNPLRMFCILALSGCTAQQEHVEGQPIAEAPVGFHKADDLMIARGRFLPYEDSRPYALFDSDGDQLQITIHLPELGPSVITCTAVAPRYSALSSWKGEHEGYRVVVDMDFYRRVFFVIGDDGEDGKSNSIGWRFDLPYANG